MLNPRAVSDAFRLSLFSNRSSYALPDATANLSDRTHYVDSATLKFFNAKILSTEIFADGLLFGLCESKRFDNEPREYAFVLFDVTGRVITKENAKNPTVARAAMRAHVEQFDVAAYYRALLQETAERAEQQITDIRALLDGESL